MAASKSRPPEIPARSTGGPPDDKAAGRGTPARKIRAGMGDVEADTVEVWTDEEYQRATGLLRILDEDGKADPATVPALEPERLMAIYQAMVRIRTVDERLM